MSITLAEPDARSLEAFCRRQLKWSPGLAARIVTSERSVGMFTTPPLGVMVFVAVPVQTASDERLDRIVSLAAWADLIVSGADVDPLQLSEVPVPVTSGPTLLDLPPSDGWQVPLKGLSGDLVPMVTAATAEFESRAAGLPPRGQETIADEIWGRAVWGGLPMRVLHAARQLGMLAADSSIVQATTCGSWKRLSTARGQVFVPVDARTALLTLRADR